MSSTRPAGIVDALASARLWRAAATAAAAANLLMAPVTYADPVTRLPAITVIGQRTSPSPLQALKLPLPPNQATFSSETLDAQLVDSSGYTRLADLLTTASSALTVTSEGGAVDDIMLRGFSDTAVYRNGLNDSLTDVAPRSLLNIERIEILKGPNAALFGAGAPGGSVNYVTKRPQTAARHMAAAEAGTFDTLNLNIDTTGPVAHSQDWQYRLLAARQQGDSFRDFVEHERWFVAPSLAWQPTGRTDILAAVEYVRDEHLLDSGLILPGAGQPTLPASRFLGEPAVGDAHTSGLTAQLTASTALARAWNLELQIQAQRNLLKGRAVEGAELDGDELLRELQYRANDNASLIGQLEASGALALGPGRHDLVLGLEATAIDDKTQVLASDSDRDPFALDPWSPRYGQPLPALAAERVAHERGRRLACYVEDLWTLDEHWRLLLALRFDHVAQRGSDRVLAQSFDDTQSRASPHVGIVRTTGFGLTVFSSYSESFDPNEGLALDGGALAPTLGKALEGGVRWESPAALLSADLAVFAIRQTNVTVEAPGRPGFETQTAQQHNSGVDIDLNLMPVRHLSVQLRYNYLDSAIRKDALVPDGTPALNAPRHQAGALVLFTAGLRRADDLVMGVAVNYVGRRQASLEPEEIALRLDAYVRADLFARWRSSDQLEWRLRCENILGERYIQGSQSDALSVVPGAPFEVHGEVRLSF